MMLFYNLGPGRDDRQVAVELRGMAAMRPAVIGLCEAIGYRLPPLSGYWLVRDTSRPGRANVAAYIREDRHIRSVRWHDLSETWGRTQHPGTHPPRSILEVRLPRLQVVVAHQPPQGTDNTARAQVEGILALDRLLSPHPLSPWSRRLPRVLLWDSNRRPGEPGPGPDSIAMRISGVVHGDQIDNAVTRRLHVRRAFYRRHVPGTELRTDHPWGALQIQGES